MTSTSDLCYLPSLFTAPSQEATTKTSQDVRLQTNNNNDAFRNNVSQFVCNSDRQYQFITGESLTRAQTSAKADNPEALYLVIIYGVGSTILTAAPVPLLVMFLKNSLIQPVTRISTRIQRLFASEICLLYLHYLPGGGAFYCVVLRRPVGPVCSPN